MKKKGQTLIELAIFGSLILFVFGALLSYMQRLNDQQYIEMGTFRRALEKACTYQGEISEGAGASVQYTQLENRRNVDLASGFKKGSTSSTGYSSSVFWAVPKLEQGSEPESLIIYRVNEDERQRNYRDFVPKEHENDWAFRIEDASFASNVDFSETITKEETPAVITNTKSSRLNETISTTIPYKIVKKDDDENDLNDAVISEGSFFENYGTVGEDGKLTQNLYKDSQDGQYKYSQSAPSADITSGRTWITGF